MRVFRVELTEKQFAAIRDDLRDWDVEDNPSNAEVFEVALPFDVSSVEEEDSKLADELRHLTIRKAD